MRGLDVLRGIAILLVLIYHGFLFSAPRLVLGTPTLQSLYLLTGWGWLGVNLFFVISGFLITGILQDSRSSTQYFQRFYTRRALRILPAYLVTLFLLWGFHLVRLPYLLICVLFLANMPGLLLPTGTALYGPLWPLAVEEQFYLVWPWLNRWIGRLECWAFVCSSC
jgi:peptidoglycan/LPS O-acetylase OafA/YrhL